MIRSLWRSTDLSPLCLTLNSHLLPIGFLPLGKSVNSFTVQVPASSMAWCSSIMACCQASISDDVIAS